MLEPNAIKDLKQARLGQKLVTEVLNYDSVLHCQLTLEVSEPHKLLCDFEVSQSSSSPLERLKLMSTFSE